VGAGGVSYIGAWLDPTLMAKVLDRLADQAGVQALIPDAPETVEVAERSGAGKRVLILLNHGDAAVDVALPGLMTQVLDRGRVQTVHIGPHDVAVLEAGVR
jgi:beta-galactosidase